MKYHDDTDRLNWAGNVDVPVVYEWNPATLLPKIAESDILESRRQSGPKRS